MALTMMKIAGGVAFIWAFIIVYMGMNLFQLVEESRQSSDTLSKVNLQLEQLKRENFRLQEENNNKKSREISNKVENTNNEYDEEVRIRNELQKKLDDSRNIIKELHKKLEKAYEEKGHTNSYEFLRRRVANQLKEMWFFVSAQISKLKNTAPATAQGDFARYLDDFRELQQITLQDFEKLVDMEGAKEQRDNTAKTLSTLIQNRLEKLQNPKDCATARKLTCTLNKGCGYGCQIHHLLYCFIVAYSTKRTLILNSGGWRYSSKGWNNYFKPLSKTCLEGRNAREWNIDHAKHQVVHLPIVDSLHPRPKQMPLTVPSDVYEKIVSFHGHPFVWWIAQFTKYVFKFQPDLKKIIEKKKKLLGFQKPIVGIQVRRTDKINVEAAFHKIEEYMYWVDIYYKKLELTEKVDKRRVFIATDDSAVLAEARKKYPEYVFLSDNDVSRSASLSSRYSDESLLGVISDIELLSDSDYLVCTFSSQVCRLAYEIMNHKHTDASGFFHSLDDIYYFGGQHEHRMKAIWPHMSRGRSELDLAVGDVVGIAGNHWDGQAKGKHHGTQMSGLFPAYKVEDVHDIAEFPSYQDEDG